MANQARLHHYVPQFYLRGFSRSPSKNAKVTVIDLERGRQFETAVKNVGAERDFNRIEVEGQAPDALEKAYSTFEGKVAQAVKNIDKTLAFEGEDRIYVLNLIALMAVRHPQMRAQWTASQAQLARIIMSMTLATRERWEHAKARMRADGIDVSDTVTYEQMRERLDANRYQIEVPTGQHIRNEMVGVDAILPTLIDRKWHMWVANDHSGPFITCNRPVTLVYKRRESMPLMVRDSPGFGMRETQLIFPLTQRLALVGDFESREDGILPATREVAAIINNRMCMFAGQVFAPKLSFYFSLSSRLMLHGSNLLSEHLRRTKGRGDGEKASV